MGFQKPPGTQDFLPGAVEKWQFVESKAREICRRFNFREIRTPLFESTDLYKRGVGETTDIVEKEMYTFTDRGNRSITLRPEGTAGAVRAFVENKLYGEPDLTKLYYIGPMFRYERQQAGRYRQFHQFGVEALGAVDSALDAEVIALGYTFYTEVGLTGVRVEINSVGTPAVRAAYRERLLAFLEPKRELLCKDCQSRMDRNPLRVLDCKVDQHHFVGAPSILESLDEECRTHFEALQFHLTSMNIPYTINPSLVRGLDYYTHTAFEFKSEGIGAIDTIGGGGRYNGLVAEIGGPDQPGVGLGLGLERTVMLLESQGVQLNDLHRLDVYLIGLGEAADKELTRILHSLRLHGIAAERDYQGRKMKAQMKSADRLQVRYTAILGDDELERGEITLKNMSTGEQLLVPIDQLAEQIK
ncbi:histidine--tRNA ligase 2 [Paenibacillus baekrokdamisoli]|uniref:Histidine--tRNA ligase n=1 Tax=Paenibacillus baekrokdamisoli TaxID=1712516 RepID=A0A3G9IJW5_9BACL|nr:histidine--tRNA ligase [Paenibacillus baekrokdamisoli]MBB3067518.1 histidyl-tRNA synthetase [Paenibacillus baekrokdamisoli]BBH19297.1 histidine--tRNA ligase 2 [Paenibacillus baekrokdamisoli]